MPRTARRLTALLLACATLVSLAACAPGEPAEPTLSPLATETAAPIFASDEEALAAAVAAYEAYVSTTDAILRGETEVDTIRGFTNSGYGEKRVDELSAFVDSGLRSTGPTSIDSVSLAEYAKQVTPETISIYTCTDVTGTRIFNEAGDDVTPSDRDLRVPVLVTLEAMSASEVLVAGDKLWTGENFC